MKEQRKSFWREMYTAAKQGSVDVILLQLLSLEKRMVSEVFLSQLRSLIRLALKKKREKEEKLAISYHRKRMRALEDEENQYRARALQKTVVYGSPCVFWQR